jgi:hypothetical protein
MATNWNYETDPIERVERSRRLKPIIVAIVMVASFALALLIANYWAATAPYPYAM